MPFHDDRKCRLRFHIGVRANFRWPYGVRQFITSWIPLSALIASGDTEGWRPLADTTYRISRTYTYTNLSILNDNDAVTAQIKRDSRIKRRVRTLFSISRRVLRFFWNWYMYIMLFWTLIYYPRHFLCHISREPAEIKFYLRFISASGLHLYLLLENIYWDASCEITMKYHITLYIYNIYTRVIIQHLKFLWVNVMKIHYKTETLTIEEVISFYFWIRSLLRHLMYSLRAYSESVPVIFRIQ